MDASAGSESAQSDGVTGDTPFHRRLFVQLSLAEQDAFLDGVRERRLSAVRRYEQIQAAKKEAKDAKLTTQIAKQCGMLDKEIAALDKALDKVEKRLTQVRALQLMAESEL